MVKKLPAIPKVKAKNPLVFLRQVRTELNKVDWPTREQTTKLTGIVVGASVAVGIYLGLLDTMFTWMLTFLVK